MKEGESSLLSAIYRTQMKAQIVGLKKLVSRGMVSIR